MNPHCQGAGGHGDLGAVGTAGGSMRLAAMPRALP